MDPAIEHIALYVALALIAGLACGWFLRGPLARRTMEQELDKWQVKFDEASRQRDRFNSENTKLRTSIEAQQAVLHKFELAATKFRTDLESTIEKTKSLSKELFSVRAERDEYQRIANEKQSALAVARQQLTGLETEFSKSRTFYKGELEKSLEKRKTLDSQLEDAKAEHLSLRNLLEASQKENASVNKMLGAAQTRLDNLDAMEQKIIALEAENAQLRHDEADNRRQFEALQRDMAELDELKVQNRELAHCLKSMESSRRQYELDAQRYRERANRSDKQSETLRLKLDDVEKSFAQMARQHDEALDLVNTQPGAQATNGKANGKANGQANGKSEQKKEVDDLTKIVGIGKVFEKMLHDLGIRSYRQIANFGPADIARVNMELKEFKGRMEQDDWVGQAKELFFDKYGARNY